MNDRLESLTNPIKNTAFKHKQFVSLRGGLKDNHFLISHEYSKFNPPLF